MYSKDCWGFRASNFIWLSRVSRPLLYSYIITTLITHSTMLPPIILNNILQLSSATFSKLSSILSSNNQQYCPPTIINIVLQPSSILFSNQHQYCPPTTINIVLQPASILSPNHHQYCPPTIINIVLQPSSILSSNHLLFLPITPYS